MEPTPPASGTPRHPPSVALGFLLYFGYLGVFFTTWIVNGVDYNRIGENAETTRLWYALPTLFGGAFLAIALTWLGWWRLVLFDRQKSGPAWAWLFPIVMGGVILLHFSGLHADKLTPDLLLWSTLGAIGVGFGEEMITRGSMVVGLRSRYSEVRVWLVGTLLFSALHAPNVLFGLPLGNMLFQLAYTFVFGSAMYATRRISGTLLLPMALHGLWDSSLFLSVASGVQPGKAQFLIYPVAIACAIGVLLRNRGIRLPA